MVVQVARPPLPPHPVADSSLPTPSPVAEHKTLADVEPTLAVEVTAIVVISVMLDVEAGVGVDVIVLMLGDN